MENVEAAVDEGFKSLEEKLYRLVERVRFEEEEVAVEEEAVEEEAPCKKKKGSKKGSSGLR